MVAGKSHRLATLALLVDRDALLLPLAPWLGDDIVLVEDDMTPGLFAM